VFILASSVTVLVGSRLFGRQFIGILCTPGFIAVLRESTPFGLFVLVLAVPTLAGNRP